MNAVKIRRGLNLSVFGCLLALVISSFLLHSHALVASVYAVWGVIAIARYFYSDKGPLSTVGGIAGVGLLGIAYLMGFVL